MRATALNEGECPPMAKLDETTPSALQECLGPVGLCRWPACRCYDPQGPKDCQYLPRRTLGPRAPITKGIE